MEKKKLRTYLFIFFWVNLIAAIAIFLVIFFFKGPDFGNIPSNVAFERWAIIITIGSIPLTLKLYHRILKMIKEKQTGSFVSQYTMLYIGRLAIFDLVAAMNIIGFNIYESDNFIYLTIVIIFAMMFCSPGRDELKEHPESIIEEHLEDSQENDNINTNNN